MFVKYLKKLIPVIVWITEDRSVNAVPQILYGQYLILGAFGSYTFGPKN